SVAPAPLPVVFSVETPTRPNGLLSYWIPVSNSVSVFHVLVVAAPFPARRSPPSASSVAFVSGVTRHDVSTKLSSQAVSSREHASATAGRQSGSAAASARTRRNPPNTEPPRQELVSRRTGNPPTPPKVGRSGPRRAIRR